MQKADAVYGITQNEPGVSTKISVKFEDNALRIMADRAAEEKTGARGLMTVWEKALREFKFELPSLGLQELVVDAALVNDTFVALAACREQAKTVQVNVAAREVNVFAEAFARDYGMEILFDEEAKTAVVDRSAREGVPIADLCRRLFKDYPFGLQLISSNTGEHKFALPKRSVEEPDRYLSDLVVASYKREVKE